MTRNIYSARPARAAIAAVLAFSATPLLAQEVSAPPVAAPSVPVPTGAPITVSSDPAAPPVMAPSNPVVQQTASVEARLADAVAKSEAERTSRAERRVAAPTAPVTAQARSEPTRVAPAPIERTASAVTSAAPVASAVPVASPNPVASPEPVAKTAEPSPADDGSNALALGLGGSVLLLAGLAGTAIMMRRRRPSEERAYDDRAAHDDLVRHDVIRQDVVRDRAMDEPLTDPAPAVTPVMEPAPMATPVMARNQALPATTLEAMIAEEPSPENPFLTRSKRKHRAMAMLREQEQVIEPGAPSSVRTAAIAPTVRPVDRSQIVHSFGKGSGGREGIRPTFREPHTT